VLQKVAHPYSVDDKWLVNHYPYMVSWLGDVAQSKLTPKEKAPGEILALIQNKVILFFVDLLFVYFLRFLMSRT